MTTAILTLLVVVAVGLGVGLVRQHRYIRDAEARERETWALLELVKAWYEQGRQQHREADHAKESVAATVTAATAEVKQAVERVPERVVDRLKDGDSGIGRGPGSVVRPAEGSAS